MKTRKVILAPEHVTALNVVQIEFHDDEKIIAAYKHYISLLSRKFPTIEAPRNEQELFYREQEDGLFSLVKEIGRNLEFDLDKMDLSKYSYAPIGWGNNEAQLILFRQLVIDLLNGRRGLPVWHFTGGDTSGKFPPPPSQS